MKNGILYNGRKNKLKFANIEISLNDLYEMD